jgi:L-ascorbate metabolism protein UlaG (beta-lactamase superfamily)
VAAQLVTHNHRDHPDLASLRQVKAPIVTGLGHAWLGKRTSREVIELDWWEQTRIGPLEITYVPAQHWSRRGLFDSNRSLWGGFVIKGSSACLYHAGDTAWFDGYAQIGARFPGIDAALLPIGAYDPAWFMQKQHVSPEQAVQAFVELGARRFVAMHWGTFKLSDEPLDEPPQLLRKEWERRGLACEALCIPAQGETLMVGGNDVSS